MSCRVMSLSKCIAAAVLMLPCVACAGPCPYSADAESEADDQELLLEYECHNGGQMPTSVESHAHTGALQASRRLREVML